MKQVVILLTLVFIGSAAFGQLSKKEALENKIKSVAEWETDLRSKRNKPVQESFSRYDVNGKLIEIVERNNDGIITLHEKYTYNEAGNKATETQYEPDGKVNKKHVYTYVNGLRTARKTYDRKDKLIGEKKYIYEFHDR